MDESQPAAPGGPKPDIKAEPGSAADKFAGWTPGAHDVIPILPRGAALFEGIPAPAIVIEALGPVIGDGALVSRRSGSVGVILIKEGGLFEVYAFEGGKRLEGQKALQLISSWTDATMSAYQLDRIVVAVAPSLYRGTPCYEDLRLEWTDWKGLLADLCSRDGLFVVELDTPLGRGVTLILDGRQVATYTEAHPELGPEGLLDPLAATKRGTIWVRREPATAPAVVKPVPAPPASPAPKMPEPAAAAEAKEKPAAAPPKAAPPISVGIDWSTTPLWRAEAGGEPPAGAPMPGAAHAAAPQAEPFNPFAVFEDGDDAHAAPSVAAMADTLKEVARVRLQRSSTRVEAMIDEAIAQHLPLETLIDDVRGLVIRGVMQATLDEVADEMAALVSAPH
ncbi:MAG: hypothetical protein ABR950_07625 [Candidatus Dormibacteria bacterium]|jgi:hypothetical protein